MIGLDTNVLTRYIMQDDPKQSPKATALIESLTPDNPGFITLVSVFELYWVLTSCYDLTGQQVKQGRSLMLASDGRELLWSKLPSMAFVDWLIPD